MVLRSTSIRRTEEQLISLTEEQYDYLDVASANDRALVTGAAGTGKTVLALEYARREAGDGRSVLLLCFNRLLGNWLRSEAVKNGSQLVTTRTFHAFLTSVIAASSYRAEFSERSKQVDQKELFSELYPLYGELAISDQEAQFDTLVIDEAQDLIRDENLGVFGSLIRGGLAGGRWAMFGDFTRQAIYGTAGSPESEIQAIDMLRDYGVTFPIVPLKVNCRNTRQIGEETALLSGFDSLPYHLAHVDGLAVDYRYWKNRKEEVEQLEKVITRLLKEGIEAEDIVILSPQRFENSAASEIGSDVDLPITDIREIEGEPEGCIVFSTVHAFKGMESPTVILTGFSDISSDEQRSLIYVGMSRARSHLVLVLGDKTRKLVPDLVSKRLTEKWTT